MTQPDFRYLVEDTNSPDGTIYTDVFKTESEAQKDAAFKVYLRGRDRFKWIGIYILYVEKTEKYYLPEDLADKNFSWEAYHSAERIELKEIESHYV